MELKFVKQKFQEDAINAVVNIFKKQKIAYTTYSSNELQGTIFNDDIIGNKLELKEEDIIENIQRIQNSNGLKQSYDVENNNFSIEMETGTGKTYVYIKTMLELRKKYGFRKFVIVVPSVAIREGVYKSLEITEKHFKGSYNDYIYNFFIYNSNNLSRLKDFATSSNIEIMIINIDSINKDSNIIMQLNDKLNGKKPIEYIQNTNPIVIIDEPQSVVSTEKAKDTIKSLNPLCTLRYSATHREKINPLYSFSPIEAYNQGVVKGITVCSQYMEYDYNKPYIKLLEVSNNKGFRAKIEIDIVDKKGKVKRKIEIVKPNDDLYIKSGEREMYEGYKVLGINCVEGFESIEFTNTEVIKLGNSINNINENLVKRSQIKTTIQIHLDKELRYIDKGIKVLSLFFIDKVEKYRQYENEQSKGIYAKMFEECYTELIELERYKPLKEKYCQDLDEIHGGYFSKDKKGKYKNTKGTSKDDEDTYKLIMKDKERLLSLNTPLRFIFSHSTLKEGWDNPNVFQVCTLIEQKSILTCRQKIGRGLRLCVNQEGERITDREINTLHILANESFAEFADKLQKELEKESGIKFGTIQMNLFDGMAYIKKEVGVRKLETKDIDHLKKDFKEKGYIEDEKPTKKLENAVKAGEIKIPKSLEGIKDKLIENILEDNQPFELDDLKGETIVVEKKVEKTLSKEESKEIVEHLKDKKYINEEGKPEITLKNALKSKDLDLPAKFEFIQEEIREKIIESTKNKYLKDENKRVNVKLKEGILNDPSFLEIWDKMNQKTFYEVSINDEEFKIKVIRRLKEEKILKAKIITETNKVDQSITGISSSKNTIKEENVENVNHTIPNILQTLLEECNIPKKISLEILEKSGTLKYFLNNPQMYIETIKEIIKSVKNNLVIDGIKYTKLENQYYSKQEVFESNELMAYLNNTVRVENSIYDYVIYDSEGIEKKFAKNLDEDDNVKMFFKIPRKFNIKTPIGTYNPDWAIYLERNGEQKLYFVIETKGTKLREGLRTSENYKIKCAKEHFKAIGEQLTYEVETSWKNVKKNL